MYVRTDDNDSKAESYEGNVNGPCTSTDSSDVLMTIDFGSICYFIFENNDL